MAVSENCGDAPIIPLCSKGEGKDWFSPRRNKMKKSTSWHRKQHDGKRWLMRHSKAKGNGVNSNSFMEHAFCQKD